MGDKRKQIFTAAIKLFAQKGFHSTSIQEIADTAGISKGAVYTYFQSKDELLLATYKHYIGLMFRSIHSAGDDPGLTPRERMAARLKVQFSEMMEHRDFITMQMKEPYIQHTTEMHAFGLSVRAQGILWIYQQLKEIYPPQLEPWLMDCANLFQAMSSSYIAMIIFHHRPFDWEQLAQHLLDTMDDMIRGLETRRPQPLLNKSDYEEIQRMARNSQSYPARQLLEEIDRLHEAIDKLAPDEQTAEDMAHSLQLLSGELQKPHPSKVMIQAIHMYLQQMKLAGWKKQLKPFQAALATYWQEKQRFEL